MSNFLRPHSKAWFEELEKQNPNQAAQTKQIISLASSEEVCTICGDDKRTSRSCSWSLVEGGAE